MTTPYPSRHVALRTQPGKQLEAVDGSSLPEYQPLWIMSAVGSAPDVGYINESKRYVRVERCGISPLWCLCSYFLR